MKITALLTTGLLLCGAAHADQKEIPVPERSEYFKACLPQSREVAAQYLETTQDNVSHETGLAACQCFYDTFPKASVMTMEQTLQGSAECFWDIREDTDAFTRKYVERYRAQGDAAD